MADTTKTLEQALIDAGFILLGGHEGRLMYRRESDGAIAITGPAGCVLSGPPELLVRLLTAEDRVKELEAERSQPPGTLLGFPVVMDPDIKREPIVLGLLSERTPIRLDHGEPIEYGGHRNPRTVRIVNPSWRDATFTFTLGEHIRCSRCHQVPSHAAYNVDTMEWLCHPVCNQAAAPQEGEKEGPHEL